MQFTDSSLNVHANDIVIITSAGTTELVLLLSAELCLQIYTYRSDTNLCKFFLIYFLVFTVLIPSSNGPCLTLPLEIITKV